MAFFITTRGHDSVSFSIAKWVYDNTKSICANVLGSKSRLHDQIASLQSQNRLLQSPDSEYAVTIAKLQKENSELKNRNSELERQQGDHAIRSRYPFDPVAGHHILDEKHYCHTCLLESPPLVNEMSITHGIHWCSKHDKKPSESVSFSELQRQKRRHQAE